ncbi:MAG: glycosyltransferase family 39 protein [Chitinophagales bacterium]
MLILLPVIAFFLTFLLVYALQKKLLRQKPALAFILSLVFSSCFVFINTELLSLFNAVTETAIKTSWILYVCILGLILRKVKLPLKEIFFLDRKFFFREYFFLKIAVLVILSVTLLISITAYPNTWDSMTYHLARVMHWLQNRNVEHYPTAIDRQVSFQPLAEYCMMHCMALSGIEKTANLVQWVFFCGIVCIAYELAGQIGAGKKGKYIACFLVATIPMAILQGSSTQNDLVAGFFIAGSILYLLKCIKEKFLKKDVFLFSVFVGLACISKGTAYIYLLPVLFVFASALIIRKSFLSVPTGLASVCIILLFCSLHWNRNYNTYGSITGPDYELQNRVITLNGLISNVSRNIAMHLRLPFPAYNNALNNAVVKFHNIIHTDIHAPSYKWSGTPAFVLGQFTTQEDSAGSLIHVVLLVILFTVCLFSFRKQNKYLLLTASIVFIMFILFCLILRWQVWHVRLHLPMLVCGSILCACLMERWNKHFLRVIAILIFLYSSLFLFYNYSRPLVGPKNIFFKREYNQYFFTNMQNQQPFFLMSAIIHREQLKNIGWVVSADAWEFPLWLLLSDEEGITMQHFLVSNQTSKIEKQEPFSSFVPDVVVSNTIEPDSLGRMYFKNKDYFLVYKSEKWKLYQDVTTLND